ncbi:DEAD/DEAH box helicase family protein [Alicyclobacillus macrosporangiidus]|uniref:Type III restriction enzyme n=1 Tax=Alicyclobacillus macrosporangiidus TaxID=392015 RepID=A0A1I7FP87_9BACL|nr:DEAD/DEAH box helicase family protein [Alicyclobacillus macrosporangiidus]SFU37965.1 type III restriction enzyme [Alicyclobacillus macrosporangiidus]
MIPLKGYQRRALAAVETYLRALRDHRDRCTQPDGARPARDFAAEAWRAVSDAPHAARRTGAGDPLPAFCVQIPTGGGKTYLAVRIVDLVQRIYLRRRTGLVLWVVPTRQIYRQTLAALKDRAHPYRQFLELATGGRVRVLEKTDRFRPRDVADHLLVLMLMLPSANRRDRETLRLFQDAGGWDDFFPAEWDRVAHERLLARWRNLDYHGSAGDPRGIQVKTSLGNVLRMCSPLVILDEGQKAYSPGAQRTLRGFNPCMVVELSATPPKDSPVLVRIPGRALKEEEMVKLDLHVVNRDGGRWQETLRESVAWRHRLEAAAERHRAETGRYIRPICLIQVERTGRDQRDSGHIHADHVRWELVHTHRIPADQIAVKSSERDDMEGIDLLSPACPIRFIITKQALQEGWDCPFAYVLTLLANPASPTALTQLVGRILRQPYAQKTGVRMLDESYVFCFRRDAAELARAIRDGLEREGLGDLTGRVRVSDRLRDGDGGPADRSRPGPHPFGGGDRAAAGVAEVGPAEGGTAAVGPGDIGPVTRAAPEGPAASSGGSLAALGQIRWEHVTLASIRNLRPLNAPREDPESGGALVNRLYLTRALQADVPNPWVAWALVDRALHLLRQERGWDEAVLAANQGWLAEALAEAVRAERDAQLRAISHDGRWKDPCSRDG